MRTLLLGSGAVRGAAMVWLIASVLGAGCTADVTLGGADAKCVVDDDCASAFCAGVCLDPDGDADGDGLRNAHERQLGLDLFAADTDGDGFPDGLEADSDTDGDGRIDALESAFSDLDGDCIVDSIDADDLIVNRDAAALALLMCRNQGQCAGQARPTAACNQGHLTCDYTGIPGWEPQIERSCDGLDNDCDGETDEDFVYVDSLFSVATIGSPCFGVGACSEKAGVVHCDAGGQLALCSVNAGGDAFVGETFDVNCDGIDNDCDGDTDEEIVWRDPSDGVLWTAGSPCRAAGACGLSFGVVECAPNGESGLCSTGPDGTADRSREEICNGLDDDCDGVSDEDLALVVSGGAEAIPLGAACGLGACDGGQVVCAGDGAVRCSTDGFRTDEICNGLDDDCDGEADELADVRQACPTAGACGQSSLLSGRCDGTGLVCRYEDGVVWRSGQREGRCDQRDDDCDGLTDEDFASAGGLPTGSTCAGVGACSAARGIVACRGDELSAACTANNTFDDEVCDAVDNDCDGQTDEGPLADIEACAGVGVCASTTSEPGVCTAGAWRCNWEAAPAFEPEIETLCDALDNDCDGWTDEGLGRRLTGDFVLSAEAALRPGPDAQLVLGPEQSPWFWTEGPNREGRWWRWVTDKFIPIPTEPAGPVVVAGQALVWDASIGRWWVQGGDADPEDIWLFDPEDGSWTYAFAPLPAVARHGHALVPLGRGRVLVHGGVDLATGLVAPSELWRLETVAGEVSVVAEAIPAGFADAPSLKMHRVALVKRDQGAWLAMVGQPVSGATSGGDSVVGAVWPVAVDADLGVLVPLRPALLLRGDPAAIPRRPGVWIDGVPATPRVTMFGADSDFTWSAGSLDAVVLPHAETRCADDLLISPEGQGDDVRLTFGRCAALAPTRWVGESRVRTLTPDLVPTDGAVAPWRQPVVAGSFGLRSTHGDAVIAVETGAVDTLWSWGADGWDRWTFLLPPVGELPTFDPPGRFIARQDDEGGWWYAEVKSDALSLWSINQVGPATAEVAFVGRHTLTAESEPVELRGFGAVNGYNPWFVVESPVVSANPSASLVGWDGSDWSQVSAMPGRFVGGFVDASALKVVMVGAESPTWTFWQVELGDSLVATAKAAGDCPEGECPRGPGVGVVSQRAVFASTKSGRMLRWALDAEVRVEASVLSAEGVGFAETWAWVESVGLLSTNSRPGPMLLSWPTECAPSR